MRYTITPELVRLAAPGCRDPKTAAAALQAAAEKHGLLDSREAVAMLLAQLGHESELNLRTEDLYYTTPARVCAVWPSRFPTPASAQPYLRDPAKLAEKVYGGRMGNRPGEAFAYRGRGYLQVTGRANYRALSPELDTDLEGFPDALLTHGNSAQAALAWLRDRGLFDDMCRGNVMTVTRAINGGTNGLADRYARVLQALPQRSTDVFLTHAGEPPRRELWDRKPTKYAGQDLIEGLIEQLRLVYPQPGTYVYGGTLHVTVAQDGALILNRA